MCSFVCMNINIVLLCMHHIVLLLEWMSVCVCCAKVNVSFYIYFILRFKLFLSRNYFKMAEIFTIMSTYNRDKKKHNGVAFKWSSRKITFTSIFKLFIKKKKIILYFRTQFFGRFACSQRLWTGIITISSIVMIDHVSYISSFWIEFSDYVNKHGTVRSDGVFEKFKIDLDVCVNNLKNVSFETMLNWFQKWMYLVSNKFHVFKPKYNIQFIQ